jgi:hypothetical protein
MNANLIDVLLAGCAVARALLAHASWETETTAQDFVVLCKEGTMYVLFLISCEALRGRVDPRWTSSSAGRLSRYRFRVLDANNDGVGILF